MSPRDRLRDIIGAVDGAVIALSGGVDSSVVAKLALEVLGPGRVAAVTGVSASLPAAEHDEVKQFVAAHAVPHEFIDTDELARPEYRRNQPDRCFHCKDELYGALRALADDRGLAAVLDGTHLDDLDGHRPSLRAAETHRVRSPLVEAGLRKAEVRALAAQLGLDNADRASSPCLSSRIAYGLEVDAQKLAQVEQAERALVEMGFGPLRVRHHGDVARLELRPAQLSAALEQRQAITEAVRAAGFTYVTLDLLGLRSGSLLEVLQGPAAS